MQSNIFSLFTSDTAVVKTRTVKKPVYQRLLSAPTEIKSDVKSMMRRSRSHPGCLKDLDKPKQTSDLKRGFKKLFSSPRIKKGYGMFSLLICFTSTSIFILLYNVITVIIYSECDLSNLACSLLDNENNSLGRKDTVCSIISSVLSLLNYVILNNF